MIPGLSLIGAGMDSCIIDTRQLVASQNDKSLVIVDNCYISGFNIRSSSSFNYGSGIWAEGQAGIITLNKLSEANAGIVLFGSNIKAYNNHCYNVRNGILVANSSSIIRKNYIFTLAETIGNGIWINAFNENYKPLIDSNYIETISEGIRKSIGANPTISNNIIILRAPSAAGIFLSSSDSAKIYNNLIIALERSANYGIKNNGVQYLQLYNNYITGYFDSIQYYVLSIGPNNTVKNNVVTGGLRGVEVLGTTGLTFQYNNVWNNEINYGGFTPDNTNVSVDPMIVNDDTTQGDLDFRLQMFSPLIDAGDPNILDRDRSRSDIGLYGGPYGWTYTYQDLAPRPPHNVTATVEEGLVKLTWNKNTEADFLHYRIYRDTVTIVIYDSSKIIGETPDTVFYDNLPPVNGETRFYYLITAFDNQGNQSYPSEEIVVLVTGMSEHPPKGYDGYRLLSNYPNPFNPSIVIPYRLKEGGYVKLYVYDVKGELVRVLVNQWQEKGYYEILFHPNTEERSRANSFEVPVGKSYSDIATGVYLYMIHVYNDRSIPVFSDSGKMILLK